MHSLAGTLPAWLTLCALLTVGFVYLRGGSGTAVHGLQETNQELVRQLGELKTRVAVLESENASLIERTDMKLALAPILEEIKLESGRAEIRSQLMVTVLEMIAAHLGPEKEH